MKALIQRVTEAEVSVAGKPIGATGPGLLVLVCAVQGDTEAKANTLATKTAKLRIFTDDGGKMNRSLLEVGGGTLVVSQFTLAADTSRGNRPGFSAAAAPDLGKRLFEIYAQALRDLGVEVATGQFGADMSVRLINDGPVTIMLEN